jgi:hypothetical protein
MTDILRAIKLTIRSEQGARVVELEWRPGGTTILFATDTMRPAAERWIAQGLSEWVGPDDDAMPRTTASASADFLPRLEDYLAQQFRFRMACEKIFERVPDALAV